MNLLRVLYLIDVILMIALVAVNVLIVIKYDAMEGMILSGSSIIGMLVLLVAIRYYLMSYYTVRLMQMCYFAGLVWYWNASYPSIYGVPFICILLIYELKYDYIFIDTINANASYERRIQKYRIYTGKLVKIVNENQPGPGEPDDHEDHEDHEQGEFMQGEHDVQPNHAAASG